jgi:acyl carrier protein
LAGTAQGHIPNLCYGPDVKIMADQQQYLEFMYGVLSQLNKPGLELSVSTELVADVGMSSLEVMEFIEQIEDKFDVTIPLNILPDISTIGQLANKLQELED